MMVRLLASLAISSLLLCTIAGCTARPQEDFMTNYVKEYISNAANDLEFCPECQKHDRVDGIHGIKFDILNVAEIGKYNKSLNYWPVKIHAVFSGKCVCCNLAPNWQRQYCSSDLKTWDRVFDCRFQLAKDENGKKEWSGKILNAQ